MSPYSSSLNDAAWAVVKALLNDLLPKDFPPYSSVYWHYKQWRALGIIDKLMSRLHVSPQLNGFASGGLQ
jgi:transposase